MQISTMWAVRNAILFRVLVAGGALVAASAVMLAPEPTPAESASPAQWVKAFWPTAHDAGISRSVYDRALNNFRPDPEVLQKARAQLEFNRRIWDYLDLTVTDYRIAAGQKLLRDNARLLSRIEARYGVDRHILVAIWGMETSYGEVLENAAKLKNTIRSLATLAYDGGDRAKFGRTQLVAALKILQRGDISLAGMTGSWAGAMGHTQFIPTTYQAYAVDWNGDGKRDIWNSPADALASAANYLHKSGWQTGKTWGYEVTVPRGINPNQAGRSHTLAQWQAVGVRRANGDGFPRPADSGTLFMPAGTKGPAFVLLTNFRVLKRYNNADAYALAVGHLADRLKGYGPVRGTWPGSEMELDQAAREEVQRLLMVRGFYDGKIDANLGSGSQAAIRAFQVSIGVEADGQPTLRLLQQLRAGG
jgi:membrane-bound lytic murein transglycosylase B